jgi:hypothetical protein
MILRNLALTHQGPRGDTAQSSQDPQNPPKSLKYTSTKARGSKGPQKSVANYVTAHTLLSSLTIYINISQMFHRHITIFLQRLPIKNNRIYFIYYDMECLLPNGI